MKYRVISLLTAALLVVFCAGATILADKPPERLVRYHQHEQAQTLADLPVQDRQAASQLAIEPARFASHLPVVSIDTAGQRIPGEVVTDDQGNAVRDADGIVQITLADDGAETVSVRFALRAPSDEEPRAVRIADEPVIDERAELHVRGHSSRFFDKKSYQLRFTEDDRVTPVEEDLLGMGKGSNWILNGPFLDKTLLRNYVAFNLFGEIMPFTPEVRLCELFVDDEYQGVYLLMESIRRDENRVNIRKSDPSSAATSFIIKRDWLSRDSGTVYDFLTETMETESPLDIVYPSEDVLTASQQQWISSELNRLEKALYSYDYDTSNYGYWNQIDVDSFVDYFIVNELALNSDAALYSTYFYQDLGGKLTIGPLWDFNNAFNNYMERDLSENGFILIERPMYFMLMKDERFTDQVIERYRELREDLLSDKRLESYIDAAAAYLELPAERNWKVWGYSFSPEQVDDGMKLVPDSRNPRSWEGALDQMKESLLNRARWLDRNIENVKQFSHESAVKRYNP